MLAIAIGAYALEERGRSFWSGVILGLGLIKFHLFVLVPVVMLFHSATECCRASWRPA